MSRKTDTLPGFDEESESELENARQRRIVNGLIEGGWWPEVLVQGAGRPGGRGNTGFRKFGMTKGAPDIHMIGANVYFETKTESGRLSKEQRGWHARAIRYGARVFTIRTLDEARAHMKACGVPPLANVGLK